MTGTQANPITAYWIVDPFGHYVERFPVEPGSAPTILKEAEARADWLTSEIECERWEDGKNDYDCPAFCSHVVAAERADGTTCCEAIHGH